MNPETLQLLRSVHLLNELSSLWRLAWPILLAQSSMSAMSLADSLMASHAGADDLAAVALGASIWLPMLISLSGVMIALTPIVAYFFGGNKLDQVRAELHQNMLLALLLGAGAVALLRNATPLLAWLGVEEALQIKAQNYLDGISWGFPLVLLFQSMRSFAEAFGLTQPMMRIGLLAVAINIPLNYVLIYGKLGLPALGGVGCGYASSAAFLVMALSAVWLLKSSAHFSPLNLWRVRWRLDWSRMRHQLAVGLPIAFALLIETSMFCFIALLLADYGAVVISAHQITLSISSLIFMLPLSLCLALTIRVGQHRGAGRLIEAQQTAFLGLAASVALALTSFALLRFLAAPLAGHYSTNPQVVELAAYLLGLASLYQFSDAIQLAATGALRGFKETRTPLIICFIAYWLVGLPSGYYMAEAMQFGAAGYWLGILIGLTFAAVLLVHRMLRVTRNALSNPRP